MDAETICALATRPGGALGIIRVSGRDAVTIVSSIFTKDITSAPANTLHYGEILSATKNTIDEVVVSLWRAPHSYTGEDACEISCHGSAYIMERILHRLTEAGCRQAQPGEYTQRAYLNGKLDLSQAEAVADLIASTNHATYRIALSQLKGHFSSELAELRAQLLKMTSLLELELDFSDHEELEFADRTELTSLAGQIDNRVLSLARSFETGKALKRGIPVAIIGKTNVGKSTLLNRLLGDERAIVSDIHGTTRDVIEDTTDINGITFRFIDTAGIRHTDDRIEQLGIERTYQKLEEAQVVLWLIDTLPTPAEISDMQERCTGKHLLIVRNKIDSLTTDIPSTEKKTTTSTESIEATSVSAPDTTLSLQGKGGCSITPLPISAKLGIGIPELEAALYAAADLPSLDENSVIVTSARHYDALTRAHTALLRVCEGLSLSLSADLIAEDLRDVLAVLGEITGQEITSQETLNNIFSHFCIGK
ncbi:MAG: tRNA uridine-5-carboxymethylaminomethyl(34) synthesis GTPase MnmE [Prevotella sp.]|nr:tRNA uridine-5-carboxymethylaminomethyl(34) synthesis GTPase MnmE [Prevotella sp.]